MSESPEKSTELPIGELKEVTLRIPGEYFFCDTVALPSTIETEKIADFAEFILNRHNAKKLKPPNLNFLPIK